MPTELHVRDATTADALCIAVLGAHVFMHTYATQGVRPAIAREVTQHFNAEAIAALLARADTRFVLAEQGGHLLGFAQMAHGQPSPVPGVEPGTEVQRLYVQPRFQGQGLGVRLMAEVARQARQHGARQLWLTAWVGNRHALAWYARQGWRDVGDTPYEFEGEVFENRVLVRGL